MFPIIIKILQSFFINTISIKLSQKDRKGAVWRKTQAFLDGRRSYSNIHKGF